MYKSHHNASTNLHRHKFERPKVVNHQPLVVLHHFQFLIEILAHLANKRPISFDNPSQKVQSTKWSPKTSQNVKMPSSIASKCISITIFHNLMRGKWFMENADRKINSAHIMCIFSLCNLFIAIQVHNITSNCRKTKYGEAAWLP